jgi:hypothetical protein
MTQASAKRRIQNKEEVALRKAGKFPSWIDQRWPDPSSDNRREQMKRAAEISRAWTIYIAPLNRAEEKRKARSFIPLSNRDSDRLQGFKRWHHTYSPPPPEPIVRSEQDRYAELIASDAWKRHRAILEQVEAERETREAEDAAFRDRLKNGAPPPPPQGDNSHATDHTDARRGSRRSWERVPRELSGASHEADRQATIQHAYIIAPTSAAIRATDYSNRPRTPKGCSHPRTLRKKGT